MRLKKNSLIQIGIDMSWHIEVQQLKSGAKKTISVIRIEKIHLFMFGKLCVKNVRIVSGFVKYFGDDMIRFPNSSAPF